MDELVITRQSGSKIFRIQKFDLGCANAFRIDKKFKIIDDLKLMHGMLLMILDFNQTNRSIPIDQPLPFRDASPNSEKTYLFDSQGGEVFWFSKTL